MSRGCMTLCLSWLVLMAPVAYGVKQAGTLFKLFQTYDSGGGPATSLVMRDVNGDGKPDLVVGNGTVAVLIGNGDGTYQAAQNYGTGSNTTYAVVVADVNHDGKLDVLVANTCLSGANCDDGGVAVLLGNGDGTFHAAQSYDSGGNTASAVAVADVDGDGNPDLIVTNLCLSNSDCSSGSVGVLLGNGNGTFRAAQVFDSGGSVPRAVAVTDINKDGATDLMVANGCLSGNCQDGIVSVFLGNGNGTFQMPQDYDAGGFNPVAVVVADINGDTRPDIIVANCGKACKSGFHGTIGLLLGNGDGTFQPTQSLLSGANWTTSVAVGDANGDGTPDLIVGNRCIDISCRFSVLTVLLNYGNGIFQPPQNYTLGGFGPQSIALGDVNGDGKPDLVVANACISASDCSSGAVSVLLDQFATSTMLRSNPNPSVSGQLVTLKASVTSLGPNQPTGKVTFKNGSRPIGTVKLTAGTATLKTKKLPVGTLSLTADNKGDSVSAQSASPVVTQEVNP